MRMFALTATAAATLMLAGAAHARPWTDPAGRLSFDAPAGWTVNQPSGTPATFTYVIAGNANNECQFIAVPNTATAAVLPTVVRTQAGEQQRFTNEVWTRTLTSFSDIFRGTPPQIVSTSSDTSGFWPIQRAEAQSAERPVHAAIQLRPGVDIIAACLTFGGQEPISLFDQVIRSVGHPNDATWRSSIEPVAAPAP